jgi:23S rRNA (uracil1939-C5)-methyltransferase
MARKKKELPLLEKVTITDVAAEGKALARVNDMVVFVPYVVPGDVVDLQVKRKKHSYAEAVAVKFHEFSSLRTEPFCKHFGVCGGCKWQCLKYEDQLRYKQKQVTDNLMRIGKIELPEISPILGSELTERYRNKLEFTFSNKRWLTQEEINSQLTIDNGQLTMNSEDSKELGQPDGNNCQLSTVNCQFNRNAVGFHIPGAFDKVLAIDECHLMDDICNRIRNGVRDYAYEHGYTFFDLRSQEGMLRNMMIRIAEDENERSIKGLMVVMQFKIVAPEEEAKMQQLLQYMADTWPEITSLIYVINNKCNDTIGDLPIRVFKGEDHIIEEMEGLKFKVGPKSFYQTNTRQAYNLYKVAREFAGLTGDELVYDLYTGTGTIANFVSRQARQVIGIEYVPEAIEDAKVNSSINGIDNTLFFAGDMKDILNQDFINEYGRPDVIITDPPRAGMHNDVIDTILFAEPKRIVYVSCNPATQARDLSLLDVKYKVKRVQPVDMFPHTHHVENVVLLELK